MSSLVLPAFPGIKLETTKFPMWSTKIAEAVSALERRVSERIYPKYRIEVAIEVLRDIVGTDEAKKMLGFFNLMAGAFDSFLYTDPDDNSVTDYQFATCNGSSTQFQLTRPLGAGGFIFIEPTENVNVLTNIKRAGVTLASPADYSVGSTGIVTFTSPGTNGQALTWTGSYYWRVRFDKDEMPLGKLFQNLYDVKSLTLIGSVMNKV